MCYEWGEGLSQPSVSKIQLFQKTENVVGINFSVTRIRQLRPEGFEEPALRFWRWWEIPSGNERPEPSLVPTLRSQCHDPLSRDPCFTQCSDGRPVCTHLTAVHFCAPAWRPVRNIWSLRTYLRKVPPLALHLSLAKASVNGIILGEGIVRLGLSRHTLQLLSARSLSVSCFFPSVSGRLTWFMLSLENEVWV